MTTLVVCGGLPLMIHALAAPGSDPIVSTFAVVCGVAAEAPAPLVWLNAAALDSPDSSDDDGDDDAPGGDAAIVVNVHQHADGTLLAERVHVPVPVWISRSQDGHALRGPPSLSDDDGYLFDGDDEDDDEDDSDQLKGLRTAASTDEGSCRTEYFAGYVPACAPSSPTRGHSLRAPPARAL